jgi:hypothetical protein
LHHIPLVEVRHRVKRVLPFVTLALALALLISPAALVASDHDDGETELKGRNLNLTDLYAFREKDQNPSAAVPEGDLVFVMNTNPRSVARQQYYFSTGARYQFHVTRVANKNAGATGNKDLTFRFEFGSPGGGPRGQQAIKVTVINGPNRATVTTTTSGGPIKTTSINGPGDPTAVINQFKVSGHTFRLFAGLREDPFFFDVEQFFRVRAGLLRFGPGVGFRNPGLDFTAGYNVNAIVLSVPLAFLQGKTSATTFDVWETIFFGGNQVERLARPAINEGLIITNAFLNALNTIGPDCEAAALKNIQPCASAAKPILDEARATLAALGNSPERIETLLRAFLPDVMRIDTTGPSGYGNALNALGSPIRGRMLLDDVIDITLSVLTNGAVTADNVSYSGPNQGGSQHKPLLTTFPYLAPPN